MKHVSASQFKAKCSALVEQVRRTKRAIQITRRGKVIAEITPVASEKSRGWLGRMKGRQRSWEILSHLLLTWKTLKRLRTKNRPQPLIPAAWLLQYPDFAFSEHKLKMLPPASVYAMFSSDKSPRPVTLKLV